jgi:hypothetical protein
MVTFTTLAESKCREPLSEHARPTAGASTATATEETRPRRAAWMSPLILAASAECDEERQTADAAAARRTNAPAPAGRASAGISNAPASAPATITATTLDNSRMRFIRPLPRKPP